jgi:twitching motility protein PilI
MSNKEALRELQNRLAARMKAVRTEQPGQSWLAVDCGGQGVLFPLNQAGEIFEAQGLVPVPHTQPWLVGVANLRGGLYTVADLGAFLGLCQARRGALPEHQRLVAFNAVLGLNCALMVDRLEGLRHAADLQRESADEVNRPAFAVARWKDSTGRVWQEIALAELAMHEMFLGIAG